VREEAERAGCLAAQALSVTWLSEAYLLAGRREEVRTSATQALARDRSAGASLHRAVDGYRAVSRHGDDVLAAADRSGAGAGGGEVKAKMMSPEEKGV
jgi:hypothetical protein